MCGRYFFDEETDAIQQIIAEVERKNQTPATGEIYPSNHVAVLTADTTTGAPEYESMIWGFKGFRGSQLLINARAETVTEKKTFSTAFKQTRCVFPTSGFYEWSVKKEKCFIHLPHTEVLYLAGFYKKVDDTPRSIILTTAANSSVQKIHDRMPLIIDKPLIDSWLTDVNFAERFLQSNMPELTYRFVEPH